MLNWFDVEKGIIPLPGTHSDAFDYSSIDKYRLVLYRFMGWYNILKSPIKFAAEMSQTFWCNLVRNLQKPYREEILSDSFHNSRHVNLKIVHIFEFIVHRYTWEIDAYSIVHYSIYWFWSA